MMLNPAARPLGQEWVAGRQQRSAEDRSSARGRRCNRGHTQQSGRHLVPAVLLDAGNIEHAVCCELAVLEHNLWDTLTQEK